MTLIICPNRLVNQWYDEINKYIENYDIKILKLMTITQYKKLLYIAGITLLTSIKTLCLTSFYI